MRPNDWIDRNDAAWTDGKVHRGRRCS